MLDNQSLSHVPTAKRAILDELVAQLCTVPGIVAVVLGGSYAGHTHHATSDLDVGLYYREAAPFDIDDIRKIAVDIADSATPIVTKLYEWGAWVNGGAWIQTAAGKVDFLYRNVDQIERTIADAQQGITQHDYGQQPAYGFYSVIYLAETEICLPLWDPGQVIAALKAQVATYPPALKMNLVNDHLWSAEFTLLNAQTLAAQGDIYNTVGCLTRAAANLTQVLFALNERYFQRDKQVMATVAQFDLVPADYDQRLCAILAAPGNTPKQLTAAVTNLAALWQDIVKLTNNTYQPKFNL